jgi:hypothetical protein
MSFQENGCTKVIHPSQYIVAPAHDGSRAALLLLSRFFVNRGFPEPAECELRTYECELRTYPIIVLSQGRQKQLDIRHLTAPGFEYDCAVTCVVSCASCRSAQICPSPRYGPSASLCEGLVLLKSDNG